MGKKNLILAGFALAAAPLGGCTGAFSKVVGGIADAPQWYQDRRTEIRGEGYPRLIDVPTTQVETPPEDVIAVSDERAADIRAMFDAEPRAQESGMGEADIDAAAAAIADRAPRDVASEPMDHFLTEDEIVERLELFESGRGRYRPNS